MQDKNTHNNQMLALGWSKMEAILDRELPLEHNRRFVWLFWVFGLLIIGSGLVIYFSTDSNTETPIQVLTQESSIVELKDVPINEDVKIEQSLNQEIDHSQTIQSKENSNSAGNEKQTNISASKVTEERENLLSGTGSENHASPEGSSVISETQSDAGLQNIEPASQNYKTLKSEYQNTIRPDKSLKTNTEKTSTQRKIFAEAALPNSDADIQLAQRRPISPLLLYLNNSISYLDHTWDFEMGTYELISISSSTGNGPIEFGLYAGIISADKVLSNGYDLGMQLDWAFSKKMSLVSSVSYNRINKKDSSQEFLSDAAIENPDIMDTNQFFSSAQAYDIMQYRSYINFSLAARYWFNDRLSISVGPAASYLLSVKNSSIAGAYFAFEDKFLAENNFIKTWDVSAQLEMKYNLTRRFGISLLYNHGLNTIWEQSFTPGREVFAGNTAAPLVYENNNQNFNRYLSLRAHFLF